MTVHLRALAVGLSALFLLSSCGNADIRNAEAPDEVVIEIAGWSNLGLDTLIAEFERDHPGVRVELVERSFDEHHPWLFDLLDEQAVDQTVDVPEIAFVEVAFSANAREQSDALRNLNDFGAGDIADDYLAWRWTAGVGADGSVFGIPTDIGGMAVAYRVDLFEAAGLPTDRDEVSDLWPTWQEFLNTAQTFSDATGRAFLDDPGSLFEIALLQNEMSFYDAIGSPVHATNPAVREAWDFASSAATDGTTANLQAFRSDEWTDALATTRMDGDFAVVFAPSWVTNFIRDIAPDTLGLWDVASMPNPERGGNWGGSQIVMPAGGDHPHIVWSLVRFLTQPSSQQTIFEEFGNFPSTPLLYDEPVIQEFTDPFFNDAPLGQIYSASARDREPHLRGRHERASMLLFRDALSAVGSGEISPDQAWAATIAEIDALHSD